MPQEWDEKGNLIKTAPKQSWDEQGNPISRPTESQQVQAGLPKPQQPIPSGLQNQPAPPPIQQEESASEVPSASGTRFVNGKRTKATYQMSDLAPIAAVSTGIPLITGLATAPLATLGSVAGGTAGGYGAEKTARYAAKKLNPNDPEAGNIAGPVAGFLGGLAGGTMGGVGGSSLDERLVPWANKAVPNFLASKLRYPATARQSQIAGEVTAPGEFVPGKAGTVKSFLPSFLQRYTVPDELIPKGEIGTPTNPGPFEQIPAKLPKSMRGDPFNPPAPATTGGAQKPFEPLIYSSETEPQEIAQRAANLKRQASAAGTYHAAQGSASKSTNLQQRIGKKFTPWGNP